MREKIPPLHVLAGLVKAIEDVIVTGPDTKKPMAVDLMGRGNFVWPSGPVGNYLTSRLPVYCQAAGPKIRLKGVCLAIKRDIRNIKSLNEILK